MLLSERSEPEHARRGEPRRPRVVPAPDAPSRPFEGHAILTEIGGGQAVPLWQLLRDVLLWTQVEPRARADLFARSAADSDLRRLLPDIASGLVKALFADSDAETDHVASACETIADWAARDRHLVTAALFLEAAAYVDASDPRRATAVARAWRTCANWYRALRWFERATSLARYKYDRTAEAEARLGWGITFARSGNLARAEEMMRYAWRVSNKYHLRALAAAARHNMMIVSIEMHRLKEANDHAMAAQHLYPRDHPRMVPLAHDVALLWSYEHYYTLSVRLLSLVVPMLVDESERIKATANLARAAGGAKRPQTFFKCWDSIERSKVQPPAHKTEILLALAEGAYSLGLREQAAQLLERALANAQERQEHAALARLREVSMHQSQHEPAPCDTTAPADRLRLFRRFRNLLERQQRSGDSAVG